MRRAQPSDLSPNASSKHDGLGSILTLDARTLVLARWALLAAVGIGALVHVAYYFPRVVDDLFISLRYAENLASGHGAVFNVGEAVEGYSSPLWMLLQAVGLALGIEGVLFTKLLGLASLTLLFVGLYRLGRDVMGLGAWTAILPLGCLAANSYVVSWALLGLETPLHLALLVWTAVTLRSFDIPPSEGGSSRRRATITATVSMIALGLSRPESPVLLAVLAAESVLVASPALWKSRLAARAPALGATALVLLAALGIRVWYYHDVFANTYYVKGEGARFALSKLAPLYAEGVGRWERLVLGVGTVLLGIFGFARSRLGPFAISAAVILFTCNVEVDWMPSLRHLLPVTILAPLGIALAVEASLRSMPKDARAPYAAGILMGLFALTASSAEVARLDHRVSVLEVDKNRFRKPKSAEKWNDTLLAFRRVEPPHVAQMSNYDMGQITQAWGVLEASASPISSSWFVGRDIGAVGYYTGVRIYDTAGLITRDVSHAEPWRHGRNVTDEMAREMMAKRPVAGEVYDGWDVALGRSRSLLTGYRIRFGDQARPHGFVAVDRPRPPKREVALRYEQLAAKFPRAFHLHTLYGESVGAAVEKRLRVVRVEFGE
ncbi:hypothetical protein AKJ09_05733 [Labilithrix luteola]|uniref:Glycosyltransferase RgtA/B/C/D-like domain-containing protein n=1 Tax=Labilithrix luteola TaxID=1391654 RepID=A0A0K1Q0Y2_9BACT|nr:hypothetical protein [Labilithrix luteola]AKU99069.1 hypothetical protein AKJ09_05733 [Labilithrix luteola]